jgi:hypothetical protein
VTKPDAAQVKVATEVLRTEATEWERQSAAIGALEAKVAGMELGTVEAGLFFMIVSPYNEIVSKVSARCGEGKAAMTEIADTLRDVATAYEEEDQNSAHTLRNLY